LAFVLVYFYTTTQILDRVYDLDAMMFCSFPEHARNALAGGKLRFTRNFDPEEQNLSINAQLSP
jgi:hypothetical protein